jgi:hypothetical protein
MSHVLACEWLALSRYVVMRADYRNACLKWNRQPDMQNEGLNGPGTRNLYRAGGI